MNNGRSNSVRWTKKKTKGKSKRNGKEKRGANVI